MSVPAESRRNILPDVLTVHGTGGKAIVFTKTKREADEVAASIAGMLTVEVSLQSCTRGRLAKQLWQVLVPAASCQMPDAL